ncbi:MAG: LysR family transcriptional regulator [Ruminococcaceae bacterium]|nr:LysR family transcriptional regulator [Oscillospiraceae bacterium]
MTIVQLRYALAVEKHQSFSKAAEQIYISQPALSLQIKTLEQELQKTLFLRTPQGVTLTPDGENFCREAAILMESWDQFQEKFLGSTEDKQLVHLRLGLGFRTHSTGIFDQTMEFYHNQSGFEITFSNMDINGNPLESLRQNRVDFVIDRLPPSPILQSADLSEFCIVELFRERQCALMSPTSPLAGLSSLTFEDLRGCSIITGPKGSIDDLAMQKLAKDHNLASRNFYRTDSFSIMMALIRSGKGITIGPESLGAYSRVAAIPMFPEKRVPLCLMCLQENARNPHFLSLREFLTNLPICRQAAENN